jgi:excisionase family DNA binding protein
MPKQEQTVVQFEKWFYGRHEAAKVFGVSVRKIDDFISAQKLRTRRIGRRVVIPSEDISKLRDEIMHDKLA